MKCNLCGEIIKKGRQVQRDTLHRMRGQGNIKGP